MESESCRDLTLYGNIRYMSEYPHKCLKCNADYKDDDPEPYYCEICIQERKTIAKEIDKKIMPTLSYKQSSSLQAFDALPKVRGFTIIKPNTRF